MQAWLLVLPQSRHIPLLLLLHRVFIVLTVDTWREGPDDKLSKSLLDVIHKVINLRPKLMGGEGGGQFSFNVS